MHQVAATGKTKHIVVQEREHLQNGEQVIFCIRIFSRRVWMAERM